MPKTLDIQGFSGLREEVVRSEGCTSRSPVLQEIILLYLQKSALYFVQSGFFAYENIILHKKRCDKIGFDFGQLLISQLTMRYNGFEYM